ncbi:MAG TPA: 3-oxoacyl-ACP synthase [Opitutae bacterium]|nr:3-oxoacyl-ACP synthase [Opitutae bacterium]
MQSSSIIIRGLGSYIPKKQLSNDDLAKIVDTSDEWIQTRTGIKTRHIASMEENPSDMGTQAAETAIKNAGLNKKDIDLLVVATMTPDLPFPSTACITQAKLGLRTIPAFDISAACSGFLYVLDTVYHLLRSGPYKNALVIGAEKMSSTLDWQDRTTCVLFGDAAGAAVLSKVDTPNVGILGSTLGADGTDPSILHMPAGGAACPASAESIEKRQHYLRMNGREVFRLAVRAMEQATRTILDQFDLKPEDIACIIPHQANVRIMQSLGKYLQVPEEKIFINLNKYGNTSAASIPVAITEAHKQGRIHPGDYVILVAFGAGLTWGATLIKWHS